MIVTCAFLLFAGFHCTNGWYNGLFWWLPKKEVCYQDYGCFSLEFPFSNSQGYLPESPESLSVRLLLYTRNNTNEPYDATKTLPETFDASKDIKIIIHGYYNTIRNQWVKNMKDALLQKGDFIVFKLDWEEGASSISYHQAVANTRLVAAITAKRLQQIQKTHNISPEQIHIIGFSLGAHLAGYIGSSIPSLGRITGLDPAGPSFEQTDPRVRLDPNDANFVDVIHTDADSLLNIDLSPGFGTIQPMGHADFYVNGGLNQPGCATNINQHMLHLFQGNLNPITNFGCSHLRAIDLFTESIISECKFTSSPCAPLPLLPCNSSATDNYMGYNALRNSIGTFNTLTGDSSPFCKV